MQILNWIHKHTQSKLKGESNSYQKSLGLALIPSAPCLLVLSIKVSKLWRIQIFTEVRCLFIHSQIGECLASKIMSQPCRLQINLKIRYGPGSPRVPPIGLPLLRYSDNFKGKYAATQNWEVAEQQASEGLKFREIQSIMLASYN